MFKSKHSLAQSLLDGNHIKVVNQGAGFHGWKCKFDPCFKPKTDASPFVCSNREGVWIGMDDIWDYYEYMVIEQL